MLTYNKIMDLEKNINGVKSIRNGSTFNAEDINHGLIKLPGGCKLIYNYSWRISRTSNVFAIHDVRIEGDSERWKQIFSESIVSLINMAATDIVVNKKPWDKFGDSAHTTINWKQDDANYKCNLIWDAYLMDWVNHTKEFSEESNIFTHYN